MKKIKTGAGGEVYSNPEADRLSNGYGSDIVDELSKILSEELAKQIDKEVLKSLGFEPDRHKRRKNKIKKIFNV